MQQASRPSLPVSCSSSTWSSGASSPHALIFRELQVGDLDEQALASLVRLRLTIEKSHGWVLLACIVVTLISVVAVGLAVDSRLVFGAWAGAASAGAVGLGFVAERLCFEVFLRRARALGLSDRASAEVFRAAADADHWLDVLRSCGHVPTDRELASFARGR